MDHFCQQSELAAPSSEVTNDTIGYKENTETLVNSVEFGTGGQSTAEGDKFLKMGNTWFWYKVE